jgi:hypothetical protein
MSLIIRITDEDKPVITVPVALQFDGVTRVDAVTDYKGEITLDPCPGSAVHLTIDGVDHGVRICHDGMVLTVEL